MPYQSYWFVAVLVSLLVPAIGFAQESEAFQEPELLYLGWKSKPEGDRDDYQFWKPDGTPVSSDKTAAIVKDMDDFQFYQPPGVNNLQPLLMVFSVDTRASPCTVKPALTLLKDTTVSFQFAQNYSQNGLTVSVISPLKRSIQEWPESGSLKIRFPIENPKVVWKSNEIPWQETKIVDGISCYIGENRRIGQYLEICFRQEQGDWEQHDYNVRAYLTDKKTPVDHASTLFAVTTNYRYELTRPFDPDLLDRIVASRQRFAEMDVGEIKIRTDLLPTVDN